MFEFLVDLLELREQGLRPCLHEQIKQRLFEQIRPGLLHTDREFEQLKEVLFAHVNAALGMNLPKGTTLSVILFWTHGNRRSAKGKDGPGIGSAISLARTMAVQFKR